MPREELRAEKNLGWFKIGSRDICIIFSPVFEKILSHTVAVKLMGKMLEKFDMVPTLSQCSKETSFVKWQRLQH